MNSFEDVTLVLLVTSLGLLFIFNLLGVDTRREGGLWQKLSSLVRFPAFRRSVEWRRSLSTPTDFGHMIRGLSSSAQLELAELLLQEGEFTRILLDVVGRIALGSNRSLRWRAIGLLELDTISPTARVSLADRILRDGADEDLKIQVIKSLVGMLESGVAAQQIEIPESIAAMIAARLGDRSESVRRIVREEFERGPVLRSLLSDTDPYVSQALVTSQGDTQLDIQRFVYRHQISLPRSSAMARRYDYRI